MIVRTSRDRRYRIEERPGPRFRVYDLDYGGWTEADAIRVKIGERLCGEGRVAVSWIGEEFAWGLDGWDTLDLVEEIAP